jgi:hypothetical protein
MEGPDVPPPTPLRAVEDDPPAESPAIAIYTGLRQVVDGGATFHVLLCINDEDDQPQPFFVQEKGPRPVVEATSIRCGVCRKRHPLMGVREALELWAGGGGFKVELDYDGGRSGFAMDLRFLVSNWIRGLEARGKEVTAGGSRRRCSRPEGLAGARLETTKA